MMTTLHGFELIREQNISEINSHVRHFRHVKTGAELVSVENDDENKSFGISFATIPEDSTGVPHILEHAVLNGSRKYPVKEPFVELLKSSMASFINAMTGNDKTMYPVASQNLRDFYNLIDVYLDAVFYPRISPEVLMQEGWHYGLESPDAELQFKGVVFNEMKGAYSSPDNMLFKYTQQAMFPDTIYSHDSGGDPGEIPNLTYEQFKRFHETFYHPSNAKIFFYGDDDPNERLRLLDEYLRDYDKLDVDTTIKLQDKFDEPVRTVKGYDASDDSDNKCMMTVSWLLPEVTDTEQRFRFGMFERILLGNDAAPLRKALIDSGLGEDVIGYLDDSIQQMVLMTGMKGIQEEKVDAIEALILDTLAQLAKDGIDKATIEAAVNTVEFQLREYNTGGFPRGLAMMFETFGSWFYGGDPIEGLAFETPLNALKTSIAEDDRFFEKMIEDYLLNNTHRSTVLLQPDTELRQKMDASEQERLQKAREGMTDDDVARVVEETRRLKEIQETPDSPEDLAKIPSLTPDDLDREIKTVPLEVVDLHGVDVLYHDLFTNGIVYLDVAFNLHALPQEYLPYVPLFSSALLQMGTQTEDYVKLTQRIGSKTGGISPSRFLSPMREGDGDTAWFLMSGKATPEQIDDLLAILQDVLLTTNFDNKERFHQLVLKAKARKEAGLIPSGHRVVSRRMRAQYDTVGWASELMDGVENLFFVRKLVDEIEQDWSGIVQKLEAIREYLMRRDIMMMNITVDNETWQTIQPKLTNFIAAMPQRAMQMPTWIPEFGRGNEGLTIPAQVNYVGKAGNLYDLGYKLHGSHAIISKFLSRVWLWDKLRVQGGAYGAFASFDPYSGVFNFASYRDPNLMGTIDNYDKTAQFLHDLTLTEEEIGRLIVGVIGDMDSYQLPDAKGRSSMYRHLIGNTDEIRQKTRDEVLGTTLAEFKAFGEFLAKLTDSSVTVVMGSSEAIQKVNEEHNNLLPVTKVL